MKRLLSSVLALVMTSASVFAQSSVELASKIKTSVESREYLSAIGSLQQFRVQDRKVFEANNYDYLLGRMAEKSGDFALAMANYQSVISRGSILSDYGRWHLSQAARATGNLMLERLSILELTASPSGSLISAAAKKRLPRSFFESKNYAETIRLLMTPASVEKNFAASDQKTPSTGLSRENLLLLADAYFRSNRFAEARDAYNRLLNEMSNPAQPDDFALAAAKGLDLLDVGTETLDRPAAQLTDTEHLRRATIYQFNRDFDAARPHYQAIIQNYPQSGIVPDAIYQVGRGYAQQGEFVEAIKWYERMEEQFPDHPSAKDALSQAASCYSKTGKFKEAIVRYKRFIDQYPADEHLDRAYLNIVDVYRDTGDDADALKWAATTEQVFKGKLPEAVAVFAEARIFLANGDWTSSLAALDRLKAFSDLGGIAAPGGTNAAEVDFLRAFVLEQLQRFDQAIDIYLAIPDGRAEYYGGRATERLRLLARSENAKKEIALKTAALISEARSKDSETSRKALQSLIRLSDLKDERDKQLEELRAIYQASSAYQKLPSFNFTEFGRRDLVKDQHSSSPNDHRAIADELLFLGLYDEAAPEVEAALTSVDAGKTGDEGYSLAVLYDRGDKADRAVAFLEPFWRNVPADYEIELMPREQLGLLYPVPYTDALLKYAAPRDIDPRFMLSIVRQESRYRAQVKSYAAARGLMQFISTTSNKIASELNRGDFEQDELYDPPTAILFGSQYLADLFKQFPGEPAAVAASYNGGDDNMKRWMARSKNNAADRFIPEIIFTQSKDYVYKVMANYRMYQLAYDENLRSR